MKEKNNINKEDLINKINLRIKTGYFAVALTGVVYIVFNVVEIVHPAFEGINDLISFILLVYIALSILDGYKIFNEYLGLRLKEGKEKK